MLAIYARWVGGSVHKKPVSGSESLIGSTGVVTTDLAPEGEVVVDGITWKAILRADRKEHINKGGSIRVTGRTGLVLEVEPEPIKEETQSHNRGFGVWLQGQLTLLVWL